MGPFTDTITQRGHATSYSVTPIVQLLVERVDVGTDGADIRLRTEGLTNLIADLRAVRPQSRRAA
jgi:hypothetical protein